MNNKPLDATEEKRMDRIRAHMDANNLSVSDLRNPMAGSYNELATRWIKFGTESDLVNG